MKDRVEVFLEDMTYGMQYEFLESAKHKSELTKVAEKAGVTLPARDLAIFKGRYAVVDETNRNNCNLPRAEVEKALSTLAHKSVDIDHFRKRVVGHWLDAKLDGDEIIAYGLFFKGNFPEDYQTIQTLMSEGNLKISFEAYGQREPREDGSFNLTDIEFSGGALLIKEQPAVPSAEVLQLAKVMTPPQTFLHTGTQGAEGMAEQKDTKLEFARFYIWDMESIVKLVQEAKKPESDEPLYASDIISIDFENNKVVCDAYVATEAAGDEPSPMKKVRYEIDLSPTSRVMERARQILAVRPVNAAWECPECKHTMDAKPEKCPECKKDTMHKSSEATSEETRVMSEKKEEVKATETPKPDEMVQAKDTEIAKLTEQLAAKDQQIASLTERVATFEKAERDRTIASRRAELGEEIAKPLSDEDVLDDVKFSMAKKDKEIAELKAQVTAKAEAKPEKASEKPAEKKPETLEAGSTKKSAEDETTARWKRVRKMWLTDAEAEKAE